MSHYEVAAVKGWELTTVFRRPPPAMSCGEIRVALSARLDGEDPRVGAEVLDWHLRSCRVCAGWSLQLERLHRIARVREAEPVPDLTDAILQRRVDPVSDTAKRPTATVPNDCRLTSRPGRGSTGSLARA